MLKLLTLSNELKPCIMPRKGIKNHMELNHKCTDNYIKRNKLYFSFFILIFQTLNCYPIKLLSMILNPFEKPIPPYRGGGLLKLLFIKLLQIMQVNYLILVNILECPF